MKILVCVLCVVAVVSSTPVGSGDDPVVANVLDEVKSCVDGEDAVSCLKVGSDQVNVPNQVIKRIVGTIESTVN